MWIARPEVSVLDLGSVSKESRVTEVSKSKRSRRLGQRLCILQHGEGLAFPLSREEAMGVLGAEEGHHCQDLRGYLRFPSVE